MNASSLATLIKQSVNIVDVIGQVVSLRRSGSRYYGLCPFHHEKTASFHVDAENQLYYCFGCGSGGDVLNFVMRHQNFSFMEAIRHLSDRYQIHLPHLDDRNSTVQKIADAARKEQNELLAVLSAATQFFYEQLHHSRGGQVARDYLAGRAIPDHVVEEQRLGFAPSRWDSLLHHLKGLGIDPQLGLRAGLLARGSKQENHYYDRFRNRLVFPITDEHQRVVAFGGRTLSGDSSKEPKYLNSPETPVYHKGRMLYQYARARAACRESRQVVLVEGYMDLLAFHSRGFYSVVANLGTALTIHQVRLLSRIADEVVLSYDSDEAGERAMLRALPLFLQEGVPASCVRFPQDMDPDDFLKEGGLEGFEKLLAARIELGTYALKEILKSWDGTIAGKGRVVSEIQPIMEAVRQPILRAEYAQLVRDRLSISESVLESQLKEMKRSKGRFSGNSQPSAANVFWRASSLEDQKSIEERIVRWMIRHPELIAEVQSSRVVDDFEEGKLKGIAEVLLRAPRPPSQPFDVQWVHDQLPDTHLQSLFTCFVMEPGELKEPHLQMQDWLGAFSERKKRQVILGLKEALEKAMAEGNVHEAKTILTEIQQLNSLRKRV